MTKYFWSKIEKISWTNGYQQEGPFWKLLLKLLLLNYQYLILLVVGCYLSALPEAPRPPQLLWLVLEMMLDYLTSLLLDSLAGSIKTCLYVKASHGNDVGLWDFFQLIDLLFLFHKTTFKDKFAINFYQPVYFADYQWILLLHSLRGKVAIDSQYFAFPSKI